MDECWRCASKLIAGSRFCPGCGAAIGSGSGANPVVAKPIEREPADPLAATAPADAAHLAALRRGNIAAQKKDKGDEPPKTKGRTVPMKASDVQAGKALMAAQPTAQPAPVQPAAAPRRVAKTQADEPTLPSHGEQPRTSPKASSTFGDPVPPPAQPPPKQPQAFQAYVPPAQPPAPVYAAPPPQPAYVPPPAQPVHQQPPPYQSQPAYSTPYGPPSPAPYAPPPAAPAAPAIGSKVMVEWADGNRYPATVQQCAPGQCLVLFPDGQQRWVDMRRVTNA
jgi:hypothetical protein